MTETKDHLKALSWAAVVFAIGGAAMVALGALVLWLGPLSIVVVLLALAFFGTYRSALNYIRK